MFMDEIILKIKSMYKSNCDEKVYLLIKLSDKTGFFMSSGKLLYMEKTINCGGINASVNTEYLEFIPQVKVVPVSAENQFVEGYYNVLSFKANLDDENLESFIRLCIIHTNNRADLTFGQLFDTILNLFQLPKEQEYKNLIGLYGELAFIQFIYKNYNSNICKYWHKSGSKSKYDFAITNCNFEVKTITTEEMIVNIKHKQIFNTDRNYLVVVQLSKDRGITLEQLINNLYQQESFNEEYQFWIKLEKEKRRISNIDMQNEKFCIEVVNIYDANQINIFEHVPNSITELTYKLDMNCFPKLDHKQLNMVFKEI